MTLSVLESSIDTVVARLVRHSSIEILPKDARKLESRECLIRGRTRVYIAYTSGSPEEIIDAAEIVAQNNLVPVPHIPARRFQSQAEFASFIEALARRAGVEQVLLIGGDNAQPAGPFASTMDLLHTKVLELNGIRTIGVAGHPEGHQAIGEAVLREALTAKCDYAARVGMDIYVVTQFLFDTAKLFAWHASFIERVAPGIPVDVGLPGLAKMATLLRFAKDCGVGASLGMLTKNAGLAFKLATSFSPDEALLEVAARTEKARRSPFRSVHFYPFGSLQKTVEWLRPIQSGEFRVDERKKTIAAIR